MSKSPKFIAITSIGIFFLASAVAWWIIATANPYSGANLFWAAVVSCPIYFLGVLAGTLYLRGIHFRSVLAWVALILNLIPFGYTALLIGIAVTGNW